MWKYVEASNVDPIQEMTDMMVSQRTLQSAAQILKMYDSMASKAATEIGRVQ
jgi:flagellar basal-body rod protein FlgG